jgi:hypothetical protein
MFDMCFNNLLLWNNERRNSYPSVTLKINDMNRNLLMPIIFGSFCSFLHCSGQSDGENPFPNIGAIPVPPGYQRVQAGKNSFAGWLRAVPLKKDRTVYLYNGAPKRNQAAQFAVLDISTGDKDLQQCADAVMRLRAEFLYSTGDFRQIDFLTAQGLRLNYGEWAGGKRFRLTGGHLVAYTRPQSESAPAGGRKSFDAYLETVFAYCGTLSLEKQLDPVAHTADMHIGDVLIHGGSPGHAMLVVDMAEDRAGRKLYLLAQSYMPAQDIHIVKNIYNSGFSPWYRLEDGPVYTPEWTFFPGQIRRWPITN